MTRGAERGLADLPLSATLFCRSVAANADRETVFSAPPGVNFWTTILGAIHKGRPHKSTIFYPLPPPLSAFVHFWHTLPPPPYRMSAMPFHFKEISLKLLCYL